MIDSESEFVNWRLLRGLNGDIQREFQLADTCLRQVRCLQAEEYPVISRQVVVCAATALANATALAAEVLALGGIPTLPAAGERSDSPPRMLRPCYRLGSREMLTHYRRRLRMAERLGLFRLCEVFRQIVRSKEHHLAHAGGMTGSSAGRHLCG